MFKISKSAYNYNSSDRFLNADLNQVGDVRIFCEELLDAYKKQNARLKETETVLSQLTTEQPFEKCDERRINLLKSQVIQLERQISLLYEGLRQRTGLIQESTSVMEKCGDDLKRYISKDIGSSEVSVERKYIIEAVERLSKARSQLSQASHILDSKALGTPVLFNLAARFSKSDSFSNSGDYQSNFVSILDLFVTTEGLEIDFDYLNFQSVETLTAQTQKKLYAIKCALETLKSPLVLTATTSLSGISRNLDSLNLPLGKLDVQLCEAMTCLDKLSNELLLMALVLPHAGKNRGSAGGSSNANRAPKSVHATGNQTRKFGNQTSPHRIKLSETEVVTCDSVYKAFSPYLRTTNVAPIKQVIQSLVDIVQLQINIAETRSKSYSNECRFYSSVHELQIKYQTDLFDLVQKAFETFNHDLKRELCDPLADVLSQYDRLKLKPTDENLKLFMSTFKEHSDQINKSTFAILRNDDNSGQSAISEFGDGFKSTVEKLRRARVAKLKEEALKIEDLDNDLQRYLIYDTTFERLKIDSSEASNMNKSGPKASARSSKPTDPISAKSRQSISQRSELLSQRSETSMNVGDILNPRNPLPQISPTHEPSDHGLPVVRTKKKKPPKVSAQYPLPDMEF